VHLKPGVVGQPGLHVGMFGESPEGVSPSGARRTVRDSRPSYGSHRPVMNGRDEVPVGKEPGPVLSNGVQPCSCSSALAA
jgi:hypothetical protein